MDLLVQIGEAFAEPQIARSLRDDPDYQPDWRWRVFERYALQIAQANNPSDKLDEILANEEDPFLRSLLRYQHGRRCRTARSIEYAVRAHRSQATNGIAARLKAMVVTGLNSTSIARHVGTFRRHIVAYEKIFFDLRIDLDALVWVKGCCYSAPDSVNARRLLVVACERGWVALAKIISSGAPHYGWQSDALRQWQQFVFSLLSRCGDYVTQLELAGVAPTERDIDILLRVMQFTTGIEDAKFDKIALSQPIDAKQERERREATELLRGTTPERRVGMREFLDGVIALTEQRGSANEKDNNASSA
jgi:hypothetical protein